MNRRGFLQTCLALCAAPAIVRADSLMRIVPREWLIVGSLGPEQIGFEVGRALGDAIGELRLSDIAADLCAGMGLAPHQYDVSNINDLTCTGFVVPREFPSHKGLRFSTATGLYVPSRAAWQKWLPKYRA